MFRQSRSLGRLLNGAMKNRRVAVNATTVFILLLADVIVTHDKFDERVRARSLGKSMKPFRASKQARE